MPDHGKEVREKMARALVLHEYGEGSWEAFDDRERDAWREQVDSYFRLDPLRRLLGTKAVEALLAGEAAVIPIHALMAIQYRESADGYRQEALYRVRLDTPEAA